MNFNKVMLGGNITRDLELRYTPKGTAVLEIGLAVNRKWRDGENQPREETTFVECRAWGRQAEVIAEHFSKGRPIFIEGRLALEEWEDKETGKKRRKTLVIVESFEFCGDKRGGQGGAAQARPPSGRAHAAPGMHAAKPGEVPPYEEPAAGEVEGDEIPF